MKSMFLKKSNINKDNIFSLSISDLMSALLLVFILILVVTLLKLEDQRVKNKEQLEMISKQQLAKRSIIEQLKGEMEKDFDIEVDPRTGAIRIKEAIFFDTDTFELKDDGKKFLQKFMPKYTSILFSKPEIRAQIGQVIIEGHTDNTGPKNLKKRYRYNLYLSQNRAFRVAAYVNSEEFPGIDFENEFRNRLSVIGKSFVDPIDTNKTMEGRRNNRRVEFKFSFIDWTTLLNKQFKDAVKNENCETTLGP